MRNLRIIKVFVLAISLLYTTSCDDFLDVNSDPNNPTQVSEPLLLTGIIANFSYEVLGGFPVRVTNTWIQQTGYNAAFPSYDNYDVDENDVNNTWTFFSYTDVMHNCKILSEQASANRLYDYSGIAKIIWAWNMSIVTDLYGNAPFSQAWQPEAFPFPEYDTQEEIYTYIQSLLDQAIVDFGREDKLTNPAVGADDFIYGGDIEKWEKLAYSLKARFYLRLSYAPGYNTETQAQLALDAAAGGLSGNADNAMYFYLSDPGQENPWFQYAIDGKWNTNTQLSANIVDLMSANNDPRLAAFARGEVAGYVNGSEGNAGSLLGEFYADADAPLIWFTYSELKLIEAEASLIVGNKGNAQASYQEGLESSFAMLSGAIGAKLGDNAAGAISTYIDDNDELNASDQVAYQQIMTQKYIANFLTFEAYNDWRRTGIPSIGLAQNPVRGDLEMPGLRFPYPSAELNYNAANVNAQGVPVGNAAVKERVWWNSTPEQCTLCN